MWDVASTPEWVNKLKTAFVKPEETTVPQVETAEVETDSEPRAEPETEMVEELTPSKVITVQPEAETEKARPAACDNWRESAVDMDVDFAQHYHGAGGRLIYCETLDEFLASVQNLKETRGWEHIFSWERPLRSFFSRHQFQADMATTDMEHSQAAISLCHTAIADTGNIVLNSQQSSQRRFHIFPETHLIFLSTDQIRPNLQIAVEDFKYDHPGELPSLIDLKGDFEHNKQDFDTLILNAVGTKDIIIFLCDQPLDKALK